MRMKELLSLSAVLYARLASKMKKPQPHGGPVVYPSGRRSFLGGGAASQQIKFLPSQANQLVATVFGRNLLPGDVEPHEQPAGGDAEARRAALLTGNTRELKNALRRVHINLGH